MFNFFNKSDARLKLDVANELKWDPSLAATDFQVSAVDGVVTLRGVVAHYFDKSKAEDAAQRVKGVKAVADEIDVLLKSSFERSDEDIAAAAISALKWNYSVPDGIEILVEKGWVTLKGEVDWDYQRVAAKDSVSQLRGLTGVPNGIVIKSKEQPLDLKLSIEEARKRAARDDGEKISVTVSGDEVTLTGTLRSFAEIEDTRFAAWGSPGVKSVVSQLKVTQ